LSSIDVFDRNIISYHLYICCKANDAARVLKTTLAKRQLTKGMKNLPTIRTHNGPQFVSKLLCETCKSLKLIHQKIPVKTPNMNAHIESFHAILEKDCYSRNEFISYLDVYETVSNYMNHYNNRYRHGSLDDRPSAEFHKSL